MSDVRQRIAAYIREQALPPDKYSHQPRLYARAARLAQGQPYDDDVLYAAAWLHDIGVFLGHRPADPHELASWDNVAYALRVVPGLLGQWGFPPEKVDAVAHVIAHHLPHQRPSSFEGELLHDADILELLGAVGILRTVSKVGRDTRYHTFADALGQLRRHVDSLPQQLCTEAARAEAQPLVALLQSFLASAAAEAGGQPL